MTVPLRTPDLDPTLADRPVRPTRGLPLWRYILWAFVYYVFVLLDVVWFRARVRGRECVPKDGPLLLLSNHSATLDPFWASLALRRPLHYMAATSVLRIPVLGPILAGLGAFAKKKYVKDRGSMQKMLAILQKGQTVVIYPEGLRTWNGETQPIVPGMGRLIHRYEVPVVYCRIESAFLNHPRWARFPRWVPIEISFEGPYRYDQDTWTADEIDADVQRRIATTPHVTGSPAMAGFRLAHGLPDYLWACPGCYAEEGLAVDPSDGDRVVCGRCASAWRLDLHNHLHGEGAAASMSLPEASRLLTAKFGAPPVVDPERFDRDGVLLEAPNSHVVRCPRGSSKTEPLADGTLVLTSERLEVRGPDGDVLWSQDLAGVQAVSVEVAAQVYLRTDGELLSLRPAGQSTCKWGALTRAWHAWNTGSRGADAAIGAP